MGCTKYIIVVFALIAIASGSVLAQVRVFAQVDTSKDIYLGEDFGYRIVIEAGGQPDNVDLAPLAKYNPRNVGKMNSTSIVNGKVTKSTIVNYTLTALQEGRTVLPPVTVRLDGKTYRTEAVAVNILKPGMTDKLSLEATLSAQRCYVGQPVLMTVKFYRYVNVGGYNFSIPVFDSDAFYFEDPDVFGRQVKEYRLSSGMHIFASEGMAKHNGREAVLVSFSKVLIPKRAGRMEIGSVSVSAEVAVRRSRSRRDRFFDDFFSRQYEYKRSMVSSEPITLDVSALPQAGRPPQFYGLVGSYTISASATPTKVSVGDPITLTVKIGGGRYLKPIRWPGLEEVSGLAANFKIPSQKASPTIENGFKVFTQTIRANNDKVTEIPSIPLAYFDAEKGRYTVAKTQPIPLDVAPTKILTTADLEGRDFTPLNREVEAIKKGLSANYEGLDILTNQTFSLQAAVFSVGYGAVWSVPLAALILSLLIKVFAHSSAEKAASKRRRQAGGKAVRQLKKVISADPQQRHELLVSIMKEYIGRRFDRIAGSLTGDDCREVIAARDAQTAGKYSDIMARCQAARYAFAETDIGPEQIKEVIELIHTIEKKFKK